MRALLIAAVSVLGLASLHADYADVQRAQNVARAEYWAERGYKFDPQVMTAYLMDQKVADMQRAVFWRKRGYNFDPSIMTAYLMDQKVQDIERAQYWKARGYTFDPNTMTAYLMNQKVLDFERARYWKAQGYTFDPNIMTAYLMDQAVANGTSRQTSNSNPPQNDIPMVYPATFHSTPPRAVAVAAPPNTAGNTYRVGLLTPLAKSVTPDVDHIQVATPSNSTTTP
jgi:hypothetical protein